MLLTFSWSTGLPCRVSFCRFGSCLSLFTSRKVCILFPCMYKIFRPVSVLMDYWWNNKNSNNTDRGVNHWAEFMLPVVCLGFCCWTNPSTWSNWAIQTVPEWEWPDRRRPRSRCYSVSMSELAIWHSLTGGIWEIVLLGSAVHSSELLYAHAWISCIQNTKLIPGNSFTFMKEKSRGR